MHIESLQPGEIFVFGSNVEGAHGAGAARTAYEKFGAVWGQGSGLQGQSYGIDTMSGSEVMRRDIADFVGFAREHPELTFLLTPVGCGIAGYTAAEVAPLFVDAPGNVVAPESFREVARAPDAAGRGPADGAPSAHSSPAGGALPADGTSPTGGIPPADGSPPADRQVYWDGRYAGSQRMWSGQVNAALADTVSELPPGVALDLGCGEGADSLWLAAQGWAVTGVDISAVALDRAAAEGRARELEVTWLRADLQHWEPTGQFDLISACFLQAPHDFDREAVLHRMGRHVRVGGHMLVVSHASMPPWSHHHEHEQMPTVESERAAVDAQWRVVVAEVRQRAATGPDGESAVLDDNVVLLQRR